MATPSDALIRVGRKAAHFDFDIDVEKRRVLVCFYNKVRATDIYLYTDRLRMDPQFHPEFSEIVDLTKADDLDLQADEFLKLADEIDCFSAGTWRAFVVGSSVQEHAARMHKILRLEANIRIFSCVEEASAWIDSRPFITP